MADNKKYYWLKLKEDFFQEDTIQWIEEQQNGKNYCLFYLKLCLFSLKTDGLLIRNVGNMLIPYDIKKLGEKTNTDVDTVRVAMEIFTKIGLVQVLENGEIYLAQLESMVGSETSWANKKRIQRANKDNVPLLSQVCPTEREREKELEKDIELDIEKELDTQSSLPNEAIKLCKYYEELKPGQSIAKHIATLTIWIDLYTFDWTKEAMQKCIQTKNKFIKPYIESILKNWTIEGREKERGYCSNDKKDEGKIELDFSKFGG